MATNEIYRYDVARSAPVDEGVKPGDPVRVGDMNGVAQTARANTSVPPVLTNGAPNPAFQHGGGNPNGHASVWFTGGHLLQVKASTKPKWGAKVYFDKAATPKLTDTAGSHPLFGYVTSEPVDNKDGSFTCVVFITN